MKKFQIEIPKEFRKGQALFNFLEWLRLEKKIDNSQSARMADPFNLNDERFEELWDEYIKSLKIS